MLLINIRSSVVDELESLTKTSNSHIYKTKLPTKFNIYS